MKTLIPEFIIGSISPYPENEIGPTIKTIKPPPTKIKTHIANMKPKIWADIRNSHPS